MSRRGLWEVLIESKRGSLGPTHCECIGRKRSCLECGNYVLSSYSECGTSDLSRSNVARGPVGALKYGASARSSFKDRAGVWR